MGQIYHGCMTKNVDGTNKLIGPGEKCLVPTGKCFWKDPRDIKKCKVKTRSCTRKESTVSIKDYDNYMRQKQWINRWVLGLLEEDNWSYCWLLLFLCYYLLWIMGIFWRTVRLKGNIFKEVKIYWLIIILQYCVLILPSVLFCGWFFMSMQPRK